MTRRAPGKRRKPGNTLALVLCLVPMLGLAATGLSYTTSREAQVSARTNASLSAHVTKLDISIPAEAYLEPEPVQPPDVDENPVIDSPQETPAPPDNVEIGSAGIEFENPDQDITYDKDHMWTYEDAVKLAKAIWGEARGCGPDQQAGVAWCATNRTDSDNGLWPNQLSLVLTQPNQFVGYDPANPVKPEILAIAMDVLERWENEKRTGQPDPGRVLPCDYYYFTGDGYVNHFRRQFIDNGEYWDWSLPSPYGG